MMCRQLPVAEKCWAVIYWPLQLQCKTAALYDNNWNDSFMIRIEFYYHQGHQQSPAIIEKMEFLESSSSITGLSPYKVPNNSKAGGDGWMCEFRISRYMMSGYNASVNSSRVRKWVHLQKSAPIAMVGKNSRENAPPPGKEEWLCFQSWRTSCNFYMPCGKSWYISGVGVATRLLQSTRIAVQLTGLKLETLWGKSEYGCMFQTKLPLLPYRILCPNLDTTTWWFL